jgi:multiple sugar transport system substrate-binding protein
MNKVVLLVIVLLSALLLLAVHAQTEEPTDAPEPITYWTWQGAGEDLAEEYGVQNAQRPVTVRQFASGAELYQALLAASRDSSSAMPDAFRLEYAFLPLLRGQAVLASVKPWLDESQERAAFPAWSLKQVSVEGVPYAVPVDTAPVALVYRADLLERYQVALPTTLAQLASAGQRVSSASRGTARLLNVDLGNSLWWLALASATGSRVWGVGAANGYTQRLDDAAARSFAAALQPLVARRQVTTFGSGGLEEARALRDGRVVMTALPVAGAVSLSRVLLRPSGAAKYRVAALPGGGSADWGGAGCALGARGARAAAAADFCLWLAQNGRAQTRSWSSDGLLNVARPSGLNAERLDAQSLNAFYGGQDVLGVYQRLAARVQSQTWVPWLAVADGVYRQLMRRVQSGDLTLTEMLERWQATVATEARKVGYTLR